MIYRDFGTTGWRISAVGLGTWNIGNQWGAVDDATADRLNLPAIRAIAQDEPVAE